MPCGTRSNPGVTFRSMAKFHALTRGDLVSKTPKGSANLTPLRHQSSQTYLNCRGKDLTFSVTAYENQSSPDYAFSNFHSPRSRDSIRDHYPRIHIHRCGNSRLRQGERLPSKSQSKPFAERSGILQMKPTFPPASRSYLKNSLSLCPKA